MGYEKEIILFKNVKSVDFSVLNLLENLDNSNWKITLLIIDRGENFNWIKAKNKIDFLEILNDKITKNEYIGFTLKHQEKEKFLTVNVGDHKIRFCLDINRNENELDWFSWYYRQIELQLKPIIEKVEWRSGYDNSLIKLINYKNK